MKRLEELPQITEEVLGGLQATPGMKARILDAAAAPKKKTYSTAGRVAAAACALVLCAGVALTVPSALSKKETEPIINTVSAGDSDSALR